ncbi:MAG TPA: maleylpyruvate isomerase family mycothiol-dependent enzyme [Nocardioides sp.]|jgi:maleylpyruvate isomerase|nr:maleylpyruvate isomerase family mycothiol-dependent enzyme [Nocardioides sp.]
MADHPGGEREQAAGHLAEASARLVRTVDRFHGDDWTAPSLLPQWTRAHVVAHLALNAEGMTNLLRGLVPTMYASDDQRARDIADLGSAEPDEIRDRLLAGVTRLQESFDAVPDDAWETRVERTPGGRTMRFASFPGMRWREVEIHHADLDAGYTRADWTPDFAEHLLDAMAKRLRPRQAFEVRPHDSPRTWVFGSGEAEYPVPVVTGTAADLAWWLTGRPAGDELSSSGDELPVIEGW